MSFFEVNRDNIPEALLNELKQICKREDQILCLLIIADTPLNLDKLLLGSYYKFNELRKQNDVIAVCFRLVKKGLIMATERKGEYQVTANGKVLIKTDKIKGGSENDK